MAQDAQVAAPAQSNPVAGSEGRNPVVNEYGDLIEWLKTVEAQVQQYGACTISDVSHRKLARTIKALSSPASPLGTGWRTMESAPKDGARFWGRVGDDALSMLWHEGFGAFVTCWRRMQMAPGYLIDGKPYKDHSPDIQKPTAWMPLPAPPAAQGDKP